MNIGMLTQDTGKPGKAYLFSDKFNRSTYPFLFNNFFTRGFKTSSLKKIIWPGGVCHHQIQGRGLLSVHPSTHSVATPTAHLNGSGEESSDTEHKKHLD